MMATAVMIMLTLPKSKLKMRLTRLQKLGLWMIPILLSTKVLADARLLQQPVMIEYIHEMTNEYHYDPQELQAIIAKAEFRQDILDKMANPAEAKPWYFYRNFFVNNKTQINAGLEFWKRHAEALVQAEQKFGVPAQYIVAILGIETMYGKQMGTYRVIDALVTLASSHPDRAPFFRRELTEYLLLARKYHLDIQNIYGSYAGAIGPAQFMPRNYRFFAVSATGNQTIDLMNNTDDAIFSIANYLNKNGWQPGKPIAFQTSIKGHKYRQALAVRPHYLPTQTQAELKNLGVKPIAKLPLTQKVILIELQTDKQHFEYWLGLQNFYAITRYNASANYAMSVFQLGNILKQLYQESMLLNR